MAKDTKSAGDAWPFEVHKALSRARARLASPRRDMPARRKLRVYAQDPSLGSEDGAIYTVSIPYEKLAPGPVGAVLVVEDIDEGTVGQDGEEHHDGVDLERPGLLMEDGLAPSSTNRAFLQQMVYAVGMETYERFVRALGRDPGFGPLGGAARADGRLRVRPAAFRDANAYYDRERGALLFGYATAAKFAKGQSQPGALVYTALSREIVAHEMSHALLDGLRPNFMRATHPDVSALHEGFSDLVAVFMRFSQRDMVERAIERSQGGLDDSLLINIGTEFGFTQVDGHNPLRTAITTPPPGSDIEKHHMYGHYDEEHDLGAVLVSAVFSAFCDIFERRTRDLKRALASYQGRLSHETIRWLAQQASGLARKFLNILIRAIDYCPPFHCSFGEFLRAAITADYDLVGEDGASYREIIVAAFRRYGVTVPDVPTLSVESLLWKPPGTGPIVIPQLRFRNLGLTFEDGYCDWPQDDDGDSAERAAKALGRMICTPAHARDFGLVAPEGAFQRPRLLSLRTLRRVSLRGDVAFDLVAEVVQKVRVREGWFLGGSTIVVSSEGEVRYAIAKHADSRTRLAAQRRWLRTQPKDIQDAAWHEHSVMSARLQRAIHRRT